MGRDDEHAVVGHVAGHHTAELCLRGNVQAVGGLVHQQQPRSGCEGKAHEHLFLLPHRERVQFEGGGQFEDVQAAVEHLAAETGIERAVDAYVFVEGDVGQFKLLGHNEHLLEHLGAALARLYTVVGDGTFLRMQQSANQIEQCRLACAVFAQQTVYVVFLQLQAEVAEHLFGGACIVETDILNLYHIVDG